MLPPLYVLLSSLPVFGLAWKTARAVFLLRFALAVLAAWGLAHRRRFWNLPCVLLIAGGLLGALPLLARIAPPGLPRERALMGLALATAWALGLIGVYRMPSRRGRWIALALLLGGASDGARPR